MTDKSYPSPCRNYLQPLYLSVTLYACAQRDNIFNDRAPSYLRENFVLKSIASTRHTRSSSNLDFVVPFIKTCQSGTFYYNGIKDRNDLPKEVKVVKSKDFFKKSVKNLLLDKGISRHNSDFVFY